jgi:hypothetical protein
VAIGAIVGLVAVCALTGCSGDDSATPHPTPTASSSPLPGGLQHVTYDGAAVDVPEDWEPVPCEHGDLIQVGPGEPGPCKGGVGVAFYRSETFDPADAPGVLSRSHQGGAGLWSGYAYGGDWAVYVQTPDRHLTRQVLASVQ